MSKINIVLLLFIFFCSNSQDNPQHVKSNLTGNRIELDIVPFSGGEEGYSIHVKNGILSVKIQELIIEGEEFTLGKIIKQDSKKLSEDQIKKLNKQIEIIKTSKTTKIDNNFGFDSWVYSLKVNGELILKCDAYELENQSMEVKKIVNQLMEESPLIVEVLNFSKY